MTAKEPDLRLRLRVVEGAVPGADELLVEPGASATLGRALEVDLRLEARGVSRQHCRVEPVPGPRSGGPRYRVVDLGSSNGTRIAGVAADQFGIIAAGDVIKIGLAQVEVSFTGGRAAEPPGPPGEGQGGCERCGLPFGPSRRAARSIADGALCGPCWRVIPRGRRVAGYSLLGIVGTGNFATVYKALDPAHTRFVALKHIRLQGAAKPALLGRFRREVEALTELRHPNVVTLHDAGACDDGVYVAMELIRGGHLAQHMQKAGGALAPARALALAIPLLDGLACAHDAGFVHRDIKPQNVLVGVDAVAKLADFGLAKNLDASGLTKLTAVGETLGTPRYMPPEQLTAPASVDFRADVYAFAAVLYLMLAGRPLFAKAKHLVELVRHAVNVVPTRLDAIKPEIPEPLADAVAGALAKDRDERPPSAAAFRDALQGLGIA